MAELTNEQDFNLKKYSMDSHINDLVSGIANIKKMVDSAITNDDLEKAKIYFDMLLQTSQRNLSKIIINEEYQNTK